jgi:hypothetical protein
VTAPVDAAFTGPTLQEGDIVTMINGAPAVPDESWARHADPVPLVVELAEGDALTVIRATKDGAGADGAGLWRTALKPLEAAKAIYAGATSVGEARSQLDALFDRGHAFKPDEGWTLDTFRASGFSEAEWLVFQALWNIHSPEEAAAQDEGQLRVNDRVLCEVDGQTQIGVVRGLVWLQAQQKHVPLVELNGSRDTRIIQDARRLTPNDLVGGRAVFAV